MLITNHLLKLHSYDIEKMTQSGHHRQCNEFAALSRSKSGEDVPIKEIKEDVIIALMFC